MFPKKIYVIQLSVGPGVLLQHNSIKYPRKIDRYSFNSWNAQISPYYSFEDLRLADKPLLFLPNISLPVLQIKDYHIEWVKSHNNWLKCKRRQQLYIPRAGFAPKNDISLFVWACDSSVTAECKPDRLILVSN